MGDRGRIADLLTEGFRAFGVMVLIISLVVIFTVVLGVILLQRTKKIHERDKTEKAARKMARSTQYLAGGRAEWLQEDVVDAGQIVIMDGGDGIEMSQFGAAHDVPMAQLYAGPPEPVHAAARHEGHQV